jgi:hypothetical protein
MGGETGGASGAATGGGVILRWIGAAPFGEKVFAPRLPMLDPPPALASAAAGMTARAIAMTAAKILILPCCTEDFLTQWERRRR